jgi:ubiquinone/menaquinone biosynthesis C-methylase UbiE
MDENIANVSEAFSKQAPVFDKLNAENKLSEYLRVVYRKEVISKLTPNSKLLELNCGTGLDALFFAAHGHHILATDNAPGMLKQVNQKIIDSNLSPFIQTKHCSFHDIHSIQEGPFDYILSNFGGLNCTENLQDVLKQMAPLLNKNGKITLMIMPKICPWELVMAFKGKFKTAFRRFKKNTPAHIEGTHFTCYYYNPSYVLKALKKDFRVVSLRGVFITVPPEFYQNFVERYPRLFSFLSKVDSAIDRFFPFTYCCDHFMITLEKK